MVVFKSLQITCVPVNSVTKIAMERKEKKKNQCNSMEGGEDSHTCFLS